MEYTKESVARIIEPEYIGEIFDAVPVTCKDHYLASRKGFNYYVVDLKTADFNVIENIVKGCETVENDAWNAQEDFFEYIRKSDFLLYAEKDGVITGFNLISLLIVDKYCIYTIDEAMVLRSCQGNKIAHNVVLLAVRWFIKKGIMEKRVKKLVFVSISSNPKVVNNYFKNKYISKLFDSSFDPSDELVAIHHRYLEKNGFFLVNEDYPFCIKNLFPGSHKFSSKSRNSQFLEKVVKRMPPEFDHVKRGDAFAFMVAGSRTMFNLISFAVELLTFGPSIWFNREIGLFRKQRVSGNKQSLKHVNLLNGRIIDRRISDRRNSDTSIAVVNKRISDRRVADKLVFSLQNV